LRISSATRNWTESQAILQICNLGRGTIILRKNFLRKLLKPADTKKKFEGTIDKLVVLASQTGAGKTTFQKNPGRYLSKEDLPGDISDFFELSRSHLTLASLEATSKKHFNQLCLHVDLSRPIRNLEPAPKTRDDFVESISSECFEQWESLNRILKQSSETYFVTYFVDREEHFRRWMFNRALGRNSNSRTNKLVAAVIGDSTHNSELHRLLYRRWVDFIVSGKHHGHFVIDASTDKYSFIDHQEFLENLQKVN
jgi:hypothetical protein